MPVRPKSTVPISLKKGKLGFFAFRLSHCLTDDNTSTLQRTSRNELEEEYHADQNKGTKRQSSGEKHRRQEAQRAAEAPAAVQGAGRGGQCRALAARRGGEQGPMLFT